MVLQLPRIRVGAGRFAAAGAFVLCIAGAEAVAAPLQPVEGQGCHTYGDNQTPDQGHRAAVTKAKRRAVENHKSVVEATSSVENFKLKSQITQSVTAGALRNMRIVKNSEQGREICVRVRGKVDPDEVDRAIQEARQRLENEQAREETRERRDSGEGHSGSGEKAKLEGDGRCRAYLPAAVRMKQRIPANGSRAEARAKLIGRMLMEAARQRQGALVEGMSKSVVASKNGNVKERFMSRFNAQARGYVKYSVVRNEVVTERGEDVLAMTIDAKVCVPRDPLARTVAVVAARSTSGDPVGQLRNELESAFSADPQFSVVASDQRHDIAVEAEIINVGMFKRRVTADELPDGKEALAGKYYRMSTTISGTAKMMASGEHVTKQLDAQDMVPANADARLAQESYVKDKMAVLSADLHDAVTRKLKQDLLKASGEAADESADTADYSEESDGLDF